MNADPQLISESILIEQDITQQIIAASFKVLNTLGAGFLEKVYENALSFELRRNGLPVDNQKIIRISYEGTIVGEYQADLVVNTKVIVECKATRNLDAVHQAQLMNYLKASGIRLGLLLNFGRPKLEYKRLAV
jgi:GxxExxY protein